jgi:hypothetical protein
VKDAEPWRNHMRDNISIDLAQLRFSFSGPAFMRRRRTPMLVRAMRLRLKTKGYGAMPESIQRWKTFIFSALQAPSHGMDPSRRRSAMAVAWDLTSV